MPANTSVAIILVNWNSYQLTAACIQSLNQAEGALYDIIVVDNASADDSVSQFRQNFPGIILICSDTNAGFTGGNNLGIAYALRNNYTYVMLLNNDTVVEPYFLEPLVNYMESHPDTGIIQPLIYFYHDRSLVWNGGSYFNRWLSNTYTTNYNRRLQQSSTKIKEVDWVTGCAFLTRASILRETGLLAENLFMYYEDVDLSFRIKKLGYRLVYHPGSVIYHISGMSHKTGQKSREGYLSPVVHYINLRNRIWTVKKYTRPLYIPTAFLFLCGYILALMVYFTARLRFQKLKAVLRAIPAGIRGSIRYS